MDVKPGRSEVSLAPQQYTTMPTSTSSQKGVPRDGGDWPGIRIEAQDISGARARCWRAPHKPSCPRDPQLPQSLPPGTLSFGCHNYYLLTQA